MDENNAFFDAYKKKAAELNQTHEEEATASEASAAATSSGDMNYNMESGFVKPEKPEPAVTVAPRKDKRIIAAVVGTLILLCVVFIILFLNRGVELIDFTGWTENDAQLWARNHGILLQVEKEYNDDYEAGKVFVQHTESGTRVKKGSFVLLGMSLGHDLSVTLPLPDIMSMTKDEIDQWTAQNYMSRVRVTAEYSDEVPTGGVIRYEVNDNTVVNEVRRDSPIYVILSRGPEVGGTLITLPNFKEMPLAQCYVFANENGLVLTVKEEYDDFIPEGNIILQSIKAEEIVAQGTEIVLVVSKGKKILVPNFSGYNRERAMAAAGSLGITVITNERYSNASAGFFLSQSIRAGRVYESGDILELSYSMGNQIIISSFVGSTQDALENWASGLNANGARITINVTSTQSNSPKGTIISQNKDNMAIGISTNINIIVSSGGVVYVPDLVATTGSGYDTAITREKAIAICEAYNIIPMFVAEAKSGRLPGEIWFQSLPAGSETTEETTITLKYVPANVQVTVPDFVGMTQAEIQNGGYDKLLELQFVYGEALEGKANQVTAQSLRVGAKVASGSSIILTVSPSIPGE
jgi:serine/threonine-protein kinase